MGVFESLRASIKKFFKNYNQSIIYDPPRQLDFDFGVGAYYGLDQSPEFQQINFSAGSFIIYIHALNRIFQAA